MRMVDGRFSGSPLFLPIRPHPPGFGSAAMATSGKFHAVTSASGLQTLISTHC
jgi:hypothetical protein